MTASKGYKAGGVNLTLGTPNFAPETNLVYEAGLKTTMLDRHLRVNGDVFYSDYSDIQLSSLFGGLPLTQNAASGKSWGAELEVTGRFGAWGFNAGIGYLDAQFAEAATDREHGDRRVLQRRAEGRGSAVLARMDVQRRRRVRLRARQWHAHTAPAVVARGIAARDAVPDGRHDRARRATCSTRG